MSELLFIIGMFFTFVGLSVFVIKGVSWPSFLLIVTGIGIMSLADRTPSKPTALDVYRGRTELKITSVNGVPVDTVVVFKGGNYGNK